MNNIPWNRNKISDDLLKAANEIGKSSRSGKANWFVTSEKAASYIKSNFNRLNRMEKIKKVFNEDK